MVRDACGRLPIRAMLRTNMVRGGCPVSPGGGPPGCPGCPHSCQHAAAIHRHPAQAGGARVCRRHLPASTQQCRLQAGAHTLRGPGRCTAGRGTPRRLLPAERQCLRATGPLPYRRDLCLSCFLPASACTAILLHVVSYGECKLIPWAAGRDARCQKLVPASGAAGDWLVWLGFWGARRAYPPHWHP